MTSYTQEQVTDLITHLNANAHSDLSGGWYWAQGKLTKDYKFKSFNEAFAFMTRCALYAEKADHHPEWFNVYNQVKVQLITHDCQDITDKDADLAKRMDLYAGNNQ